MAIDKTKTVKQSNNLTISKYTLTTLEQRILFAICSQIPRNTDDFVSVRMSVSDIADFCGITSANKYSSIRQITDKLMRRIVTIPTADGGEYTSHWLQSRRYYVDGSIEFKLDSTLKREYLKLRKAYLDVPALMLMSFKKSYSARLYLILKRMIESSGCASCKFEYSLSFFREKFELGKTYNKLSNLQNGVLEPALIEINDKSDIKVDHEYIKQGRTYTKIKFSVELKDQKAQLPTEPTIEKKLEELRHTKLFAENEVLIEKLSRHGILLEQSNKLISRYGSERIEANLRYAISNNQNKKSMPGWIISCIEQDHATAARAAENLGKKAAEREREKILAKLEPMPIIDIDPDDKRTVRERIADFKKKFRKPGGGNQ